MGPLRGGLEVRGTMMLRRLKLLARNEDVEGMIL